jgi:hypothetical protein
VGLGFGSGGGAINVSKSDAAREFQWKRMQEKR